MENNWVGFRPSPKADGNLVPVTIDRELAFKLPLTHVLPFMTGAPQLGSWLSPVLKVDARPGGRIEFRAEKGFEHGGAYSSIDIPKRIVLVTEKFGEIDAQFSERDSKTIVNFTFSKLVVPDESAEFEKAISEAVTRFIAMVTYK